MQFSQQSIAEFKPVDPRLAAVVESWATIGELSRVAINAIIEAALTRG